MLNNFKIDKLQTFENKGDGLDIASNLTGWNKVIFDKLKINLEQDLKCIGVP